MANRYCFFLGALLLFLSPLSVRGEKSTLRDSARVFSAHFSSEENLETLLIDQIDRETRSLRIAVFTFSHYEIAKALVRAKRRGVDVAVLIDPSSAKRKAISLLKKAEIPLWVWDAPPVSLNKRSKGYRPLMHEKYCLFGDKKLWMGSFNFTMAAVFNRESILLIEDEMLAATYQKHFEFLLQHGSTRLEDFLDKKPKKSLSSKGS